MSDVLTFKYSAHGEAKRSRIRRLPKYYVEELESVIKREAMGVIKEFEEGIRNRTFDLMPLQPKTIARKRAQGMERPDTPLYGLGDDSLRSYINMMKLRKIKNGWRVVPSKAMHHSGRIRLDYLFTVHETGVIIKRWSGTKMFLIRIPPRPAFFYAFRRHMIKRRRIDPGPEVRRAITALINTGDTKLHKQVKERRVAGLLKDLREI